MKTWMLRFCAVDKKNFPEGDVASAGTIDSKHSFNISSSSVEVVPDSLIQVIRSAMGNPMTIVATPTAQ